MAINNQTYAENLPYWQTSRSGVETWMDKVKREIARAGGEVLSTMYGDDSTGRAAFMIRFRFGPDEFRTIWPVTKSKSGNDKAEKIQAVTMLYHTVKAKAVEVRVRGARVAFYGDLLLSDGHTAAEASQELFLESLPALLPAPGGN